MPTDRQIKAAAIEATIFMIGYYPQDYKKFQAMARAMLNVAESEVEIERALKQLGDSE